MSRLKKIFAAGAVAALASTGAMLGLGQHTASASTPVLNGTVGYATTLTFIGEIHYMCWVSSSSNQLDASGGVGPSGALYLLASFQRDLGGFFAGFGAGFTFPIPEGPSPSKGDIDNDGNTHVENECRPPQGEPDGIAFF